MAEQRDQKLFVGPRLKRLRQASGLTQTEMAQELEISPSYLNLIERNQRPLTAQLLLKLAAIYDYDITELAGTGDNKRIAELNEVLSDPIFDGERLSRLDIQEAVKGHPALTDSLLHLYSRFRDLQQRSNMLSEQMADRDKVELFEEGSRAVEDVRAYIHAEGNYFPALDDAAEAMAHELGLEKEDSFAALKSRLDDKHGLRVRVVPHDVMRDTLRYFDRHRKRIDLSELLHFPGRRFQLAYQLALLEHKPLIDDAVKAGTFKDRETENLARVSMANYFAAALLMPYRPFLKAAEQSGYDIDLLAQRFGASFEQVSHRLTTLQKPGERGVPFFFIRIDTAGNVSKRFSSGSFHFSKFGGACPKWNIHDCFQVPGNITTQLIQMPDETTYFSIARTVTRAGSTYGRQAQRLAIGLGCELRHAHRLVYAAPYDLENPSPTPIGVNCYLCERSACEQRAHAPLNRQLLFDERFRGISSFRFVSPD